MEIAKELERHIISKFNDIDYLLNNNVDKNILF